MNNELRDAYEVEYDDCFDPYKDDDNEIMIETSAFMQMINNKARKVITQYLKLIHYDEPLAFDLIHDDKGKDTLMIYTYRPGFFIGYHGHNIAEFHKMWKEEFGEEIEVKFTSFHNGGVITI